MFIETSLLFKTIIVLSSQLAIVLAGCFFSLRMAREAYEKNSTFMGLSFKGSVNMKRKLDLIPYLKQKDTFPKNMAKVIDKDTTEFVSAKDQDEVIAFMKDGYRHSPEDDGRIFALFITWCITLFVTAAFVTLNSGINTWILLSIFSATSILFGPLLGLIMLEMDENDGFTALKIVLVVTILTGFIGYSDFYSFSEDPLFGAMLMFSLFGLLIFNFDCLYCYFDVTLESDDMTLNVNSITTTATLSTGISNGNVLVATSGIADNDFLRVDGTSIEGRSASEVLSDIGATTATAASDEATALAIALG